MQFDKKEQGKRIKLLRSSLKMNQNTFAAEVLECHQAYYSQVERGEKSISYGLIENIAKRFKDASSGQMINLNWLLFGVGDMYLENIGSKKTDIDDNYIDIGNSNAVTINHNKVLHEKDIEIAGLKGQIEALERMLSKK